MTWSNPPGLGSDRQGYASVRPKLLPFFRQLGERKVDGDPSLENLKTALWIADLTRSRTSWIARSVRPTIVNADPSREREGLSSRSASPLASDEPDMGRFDAMFQSSQSESLA
jgi:hypothetical protein